MRWAAMQHAWYAYDNVIRKPEEMISHEKLRRKYVDSINSDLKDTDGA
jgi:hypothetical protein